MTNLDQVGEFYGCYAIINTNNDENTYIQLQGNNLIFGTQSLASAAGFAIYRIGTAQVSAGDSDIFHINNKDLGGWLDVGELDPSVDNSDVPGINYGKIYVIALLDNPGTLRPFMFQADAHPSGTQKEDLSDMAAGTYIENTYIWLQKRNDHPAWGDNGAATWAGAIWGMRLKLKMQIPHPSVLKQQPQNGIDFGHIYLVNTDFAGAHLINCNFSRTTIGRSQFHNAILDGSNFAGRDLQGSTFQGASLKNVDFSGAVLKNVDFTGATLDNADFSGADLSGANLSQAIISSPGNPIRIGGTTANRTIFAGAKIRNALRKVAADPSDYRCDWSYANLDGASFLIADQDQPQNMVPDVRLSYLIARNAILTNLHLSGNGHIARLEHADLSNSELSGTLLVGAILDYADLSGIRAANPDGNSPCNLSEAQMLYVRFNEANLTNVEMPYCYFFGTGASMAGAILKHVNFVGAYLVAADFSQIADKDAQGCNFDGACLANASFSGTNLSELEGKPTSFVRACLQGVDFRGVNANGANFVDAAVSTGSGTLAIKQGFVDGTNIPFGPTLLPDSTNGATCPNHGSGPCSGAMWNSDNSPMTEWHYTGGNDK